MWRILLKEFLSILFTARLFAEHCKEQTIEANRDDLYSSTINLPSARSTIANATSNDRTAEHPVNTGQNTYRCYSTSFPDTTLSHEPLTARSAISSGTIARVERRCKINNIPVGENEATKQDKYEAYIKSRDLYIKNRIFKNS